MFRFSFWIIIVVLSVTSCGYQSSFQKQKYLKGNLKQTFGDVEHSEELEKVNLSKQPIQFFEEERNYSSDAPLNDLLAPIDIVNHELQNESGIKELNEQSEERINETRKSPKSKNSRRTYKNGKIAGLTLLWFGFFVILFGLLAPLLFSTIGWWSILIAFLMILVGTFIMAISSNWYAPNNGAGTVYAAFICGIVGLSGLALWGIGGLIKWLIE